MDTRSCNRCRVGMCWRPFGWVETGDACLTLQEAVACQNQLNAAEKVAEMAKTEEQKTSLEYQAASCFGCLYQVICVQTDDGFHLSKQDGFKLHIDLVGELMAVAECIRYRLTWKPWKSVA